MFNKEGNYKKGDVLITYYSQREWAIYKVYNVKGNVGYWKPLVISDMTVSEWGHESKYREDMKSINLDSNSIRQRHVMRLSDNTKDAGIKSIMYQSIKKVLEGRA